RINEIPTYTHLICGLFADPSVSSGDDHYEAIQTPVSLIYANINIIETQRVNNSKRLDGQVVVITGGNTGIGKETAFQLSLRGAKVYIGCRDETKAETAIRDIKARNPKANIKQLKLDLCLLKSVRDFAKNLSQFETQLDILINNAGVFGCPEGRTQEGFELHFGINYLSHFLLTLHLLPLMRVSPKARVINVAAGGYGLGKINFTNINLRNGVYNRLDGYNNSAIQSGTGQALE
ncbi:unnamed protein product, partial [Medioppia subpectinata]